MRVIEPITLDDTIITTTVLEDDYPVWSPGSYNQGDRVIKTNTHRIYEALSTTTDDPEVGVDAVPPTWLDVGATRPFRMFDGLISSQSNSTTDVVVTIDSGRVLTTVAGFNIQGVTNINILLEEDTTERYNRDIPLNDESGVVDWWTYYNEPISRAEEFQVTDLPSYVGIITITFTVPTEAFIGELISGIQIPLGIANYGSRLQLLDFSRKDRDEFGNFSITPRNTSKLVTFDVSIDKSKINYVFNKVSKLTTIPVVWVGTEEEDDPTLVYGYYRDFRINISSPTICDCSIEIEGLV